MKHFKESRAKTIAFLKTTRDLRDLRGHAIDSPLGKQLDVRGTPTFFVNGVKFDTAIQPQYFDQAIAYELKHASAAK